ncbi:MAG: MFS transporter [Nitrospirae bacterium]|nr:MFS transporter [Nitrospirota bacterium]
MRGNVAIIARAIRSNPTIAAVTAEGFLTRLGFGMVSFALPLYALALGMSVAEVGILYAVRSVTTIMVKPVMGWAADHLGRKRTLLAAVILRCLVGFLFVFATLPWHLYVIRILSGAMTAARDPSASALIAEHGNKRNMASSFAWYTTAREVGKSLGYAVAGLLITAPGGYRTIFLIAFLTSCAALVTVIRYVREHKNSEDEEVPDQKVVSSLQQQPPKIRHSSLLIRYAGFGLMVALNAEMMRGLFPIIATQYAHLTEGQAGIAAGASTIAILAAGPIFGWLSDNFSRKLALSARSFANLFSSLLYIFVPTFSGFLTARVMDDTGKAAFRPAWGAMLAEVSDADPASRGRTISLIDSASNIGEVLGPTLAGILMAAFGLPVMLSVRVVLSLIVEIQAFITFKGQV